MLTRNTLSHYRLSRGLSLAALVLAFALVPTLVAEASLYQDVDSETGGPMVLGPAVASYNGGIWTINLSGTNTSAQTLYDVHWVHQFVWGDEANPATAYTWDNTNQIWRRPSSSHTVATYGVMGQTELMSMAASNIDTPLSVVYNSSTASLSTTDSVPSLSLGDIGPGITTNFTVYHAAPSNFAFNAGGYFVAVPEPSTFALLAVGSCLAGLWAVRRRKA